MPNPSRDAIDDMVRVVEDVTLSHSPRPASFIHVRPDQWRVIKLGARAAQSIAADALREVSAQLGRARLLDAAYRRVCDELEALKRATAQDARETPPSPSE